MKFRQLSISLISVISAISTTVAADPVIPVSATHVLRPTCEAARDQLSRDYVSEGHAATLAQWIARQAAIRAQASEVASALNQFLAELGRNGQILIRAYSDGQYVNRRQIDIKINRAVESVQGTFERVLCNEGSTVIDNGTQPPICSAFVPTFCDTPAEIPTPPRAMRTIRYVSGTGIELAQEQAAHQRAITQLDSCYGLFGGMLCNEDTSRVFDVAGRRLLAHPLSLNGYLPLTSIADIPVYTLTKDEAIIVENTFHQSLLAEIRGLSERITSYIEACNVGPVTPDGPSVRVCRQLSFTELRELAVTAQPEPNRVISVNDVIARNMPTQPAEQTTWVQTHLTQTCRDVLAVPLNPPRLPTSHETH